MGEEGRLQPCMRCGWLLWNTRESRGLSSFVISLNLDVF